MDTSSLKDAEIRAVNVDLPEKGDTSRVTPVKSIQATRRAVSVGVREASNPAEIAVPADSLRTLMEARRLPLSSIPVETLREEIDRLPDADIDILLRQLLEEVDGRRKGYEFYPSSEERQELMAIFKRTVEYIHSNNVSNLVLLDRAARPAYIGIKEVWRRQHPGEASPDIYFLNPNGFVTLEDRKHLDRLNMPLGLKLTRVGQYNQNDARTEQEIKADFEENYQRLFANKDKTTLLMDTCVHSGISFRPVFTKLRNMGFIDLRTGVVGNDRNFSGVNPDMVVLRDESVGVCYPFDEDNMIEKSFESTKSLPNPDVEVRARSTRLRIEIHRIIDEYFADHPEEVKQYANSQPDSSRILETVSSS